MRAQAAEPLGAGHPEQPHRGRQRRRRVGADTRAQSAVSAGQRRREAHQAVPQDAIRCEKQERDELNFLHFEQMMVDGRRKRREEEEEEKKKQKAMQQKRAAENPEHDDATEETSPFSGEKIVPVQDCEFIQQEREKRWAAVVNAGIGDDGGGNDTREATESTSNQDEEETTVSTNSERENAAIPVDARRLELLHQCATVGSGAHSSRDPLVDSSSAAEIAEDEAKRRQRIKDKAQTKVQELKAKKVAALAAAAAAVAAERIPAATRLINCDSVYLVEREESEVNAAESQTPLLPPPAPVILLQRSAAATPSASGELSHTNVDELD